MVYCNTCETEKDVKEFYKQKGRARSSNCKVCRLRINQEWRNNNKEKVKLLQNRWAKNNPELRKATSRKYRKSEKYKQKMIEMRETNNYKKRIYMKTENGKKSAAKRYLSKKQSAPEKLLARGAVNTAIARGKMVKLCKCEYISCNDSKVEGHHFDYNKKLSVTWLCKRHHRLADLVRKTFYKYNVNLNTYV